MAKLEIKNLKFGYDKHLVLDDVSFSIDDGDILAVIGESGCGKSTLLRTIAGFETPQYGKIIIDGNTMNSDSNFYPAEKRNLGVVFQDYALFPNYTVQENILYGSVLSANSDEFKNLISMNHLDGLEGRYPSELSGGQQQRVALVRALAMDPTLLLLDEPFSNIDNLIKNQVRTETHLMLKESGKAAIVVTHDIQDAFAIANKILILRNGKIQQFGTPQELYENPSNTFVASFLGDCNLLKMEGAIQTFVVKEFENQDNKIDLMIRPEDISISDKGDFEVNVLDVQYVGHGYKVSLKLENQMLFCYLSELNGLKIGNTARIKVDRKSIRFF